jgi:hypothetical protein
MDVLKRAIDKAFGTHIAGPRVVDEIKAMGQLAAGWNTHQAPRISEQAIRSALEVVALMSRLRLALPSAAPTPLGGVALMWEFGDLEAQLLIDDESFDYSVARRAHPKVIDQGSVTQLHDVEERFIQRHLSRSA